MAPFDSEHFPLPRPIPEGHRRLEDLEFQMPQKAFAPSRPAIPEGHRRLLVLAEFLETVPDEKLDLSVWSHGPSCGTSGCALGWACMIPEFRDLGLRFSSAGLGTYPAYGGHDSPLSVTLAASAFFGIPRAMARRFFLGSSKTGKAAREHVTARIRAFVAEQSQAAVQAGEAK